MKQLRELVGFFVPLSNELNTSVDLGNHRLRMSQAWSTLLYMPTSIGHAAFVLTYVVVIPLIVKILLCACIIFIT